MPEVRLIDANEVVTIQVFDEMTEEYSMETLTVAEAIDRWSDEGCPPTIDAVPVVRCRECWRRGKPNYCPMCQLCVYGAVPPYDKDVDLTEDDGFCHLGAKMDAND